MRYKTTSLAIAILLISTPVFSQEKSYIVVETPRTIKPTVVLTGQPFTQTYVVRFIDLTDEGEELIIQEDALNPGMLGNFEVMNLYINKTTIKKEFLEHRWYLTYTLRIINPEKGPYVIPPLTIPWVLKDIGQDLSDPTLKVNTDFKTDQINLNYVSTIPTEETNLDIRDEINFGSYGTKLSIFRAGSWILALVPGFVIGYLLIRSRRAGSNVSFSNLVDTPEDDMVNVSILRPVSKRKALADLKYSIAGFLKLGSDAEKSVELKSRISESLNEFLRVSLSLNVGSTPSDMLIHAEKKLKEGFYKQSMLKLVGLANFYYQSLQKNGDSSEFAQQVVHLDSIIHEMNWYSRLLKLLKFKRG